MSKTVSLVNGYALDAELLFKLPIEQLEAWNRSIQYDIERTAGEEQQQLILLKLRTNTKFDRMRRAIG